MTKPTGLNLSPRLKECPSLAISNEVTSNKVYVVVMPDAVVVKKLQKLPDPSKVLLISINKEYVPYEVQVSDIQELWQVNSKLTFNLDAPSESSLLRELQQGMEELKNQMRNLQ